MKILKKIAGK